MLSVSQHLTSVNFVSSSHPHRSSALIQHVRFEIGLANNRSEADAQAVAAPDVAADTGPQLTPDEQKAQVSKLVAEGKKAIALKQWEEGVAKYADALEIK